MDSLNKSMGTEITEEKKSNSLKNFARRFWPHHHSRVRRAFVGPMAFILSPLDLEFTLNYRLLLF